jgi:5-methylcytosine-specific restriction endonuclease McrA
MISATLRRMVRINYGFACGYCGVTETEVGASLAVEHYKPREAGGTDDIENLIYSCPMCNAYKGDIGMKPPVRFYTRSWTIWQNTSDTRTTARYLDD